ncbi:substrate-binding domain-containing protein [Actinoplanes subtropicus]|uniref:substrate-binding domain-containing protein n=1 Tax=Actinoplanes subtropicus TaxID=543632 RepID=UPI000690FB2A|nr:substrate-binding domain-containing protein [Actinoplanes subtropicus]
MTDERLFQVQRHERLLTELHRLGAVRVRELARDLGVSELTIRRDIAALAARNLVNRVHGGATLPSRSRPAGRPRAATATGFAIGMVVPSLDFYWPPVIAGARAAAAALGVTVQLRGSSYDPDEDRRQISRLVEAGEVRGLLLAPALDDLPGDDLPRGDLPRGDLFRGDLPRGDLPRGDLPGGDLPGGDLPGDADDMIDWIGRLPIPCVLVERQPHRRTAASRRVEWVRSDHALGLEIAVQHLREHGHRRIGVLLSRGSPTSAYLRHPDLPPPTMLDDPPHRVVRDVLADCRRRGETALIVHSDPHAIAVAQACAEQGLRIPEDIALISYDDEVAHLAEPALTAVRPPKNHVGRLAVELIVTRLLDGSQRPVQGVLVAPSLVVRQSSPFHVRI